MPGLIGSIVLQSMNGQSMNEVCKYFIYASPYVLPQNIKSGTEHVKLINGYFAYKAFNSDPNQVCGSE